MQHEEGSEMRHMQFEAHVFVHVLVVSVCVHVCTNVCVCLCVQAAQLSQPWGALCGPVIVVLMYFFNIQWNYGNRTTGRSGEKKRQKEREREEVEEEKGSPLSH